MNCINAEVGRRISRFEMGRLTGAENEQFELHLTECDFCLHEVQAMMPVVATMRNEKDALLKGLHDEGISFDSLREKLLSEARTAKKASILTHVRNDFRKLFEHFGRPIVWGPVAVAATACLVFVLRLGGPQPVSPFAACLNFEKLPYQSIDVRGESIAQGKQYFDSGMAQYLRNDYRKAIDNLRQAAKSSPNDERIWLYLGVASFLDRQPDLSVEALTTADTIASPALKTRTGWYRAQAYLLAGDSGKAVPLLDRVIRERREYASEAEALLVKIRSDMAIQKRD
jgi:tetratricopeptide (TPR) repeat protein